MTNSASSEIEAAIGSDNLSEGNEQGVKQIPSHTGEKFEGPDIPRDPREAYDLGEDHEAFPLTPGEISLFRSLTPGEIKIAEAQLGRHPRRRGRDCLNRGHLVLSMIPDVLAEAIPPSYVASSKYFGGWLAQHRLLRRALTYPGIGDAMGRGGLNLAYTIIGVSRYFSLLSAYMTAQEKAAHQAELNLARISVVRRLIIG